MRNPRIFISIPVIILAGSIAQLSAKIIYIDAAATGANNGSSWTHAYVELQSALAVAEHDDEIRVATGTYTPDFDPDSGIHNDDPGIAFQIPNGIKLYGGFPVGGGIWELRDPNTNETILSGDLAGDDAEVAKPSELITEATRGENSYNVVVIQHADPNTVIDGFIIERGNANDTDWNMHSFGGGLYNLGNPRIKFCIFRYNAAYHRGGGIFSDSDDLFMEQCSLFNNAVGHGLDSFEIGGGMVNGGNNSVLMYCTFRNNVATGNGGGMFNQSNHLKLYDCNFINNSANGRTGCCGGLGNWTSSPELRRCRFIGNMSDMDGGAMGNSGGSSPICISCEFQGNESGHGGGVSSGSNSNPVLIHCTIVENTGDLGGGIRNLYGSTTTLYQCIVWDNEYPQIFNDPDSSTIISYSCIEGWPQPDELGNIGEYPLFIRHGYWHDNGTTWDQTDDYWVAGDYHLHWDSPCINAGDPDFVPDPDETDIDGQPRIRLGRVDMGADEAGSNPADFDESGRVDIGDYGILAATWLIESQDAEWNPLCDISPPSDAKINALDLKAYCDQWLWQAPWYME